MRPLPSRKDVLECKVPQASRLRPAFVGDAWFCHACCAPLTMQPPAGVVDLFFGIFGHHPWWMKRALLVRNRLAGLCGLSVPASRHVMQPRRRDRYTVGDDIGPWPIFSIDETELVAGRNNGHLDFRVSIWRDLQGPTPRVVVSTACITHHWVGKAYLFIIIPLHRWGVRAIMARALRDGRL